MKSLNFFCSVDKKLLVSLLIFHVFFLFVKICLGNFFLIDSYEYYSLAENINNHFVFYSGDIESTINFENYSKRPPLYSIFIIVFSFFLKSKISILVFQNILSIISILLCLNLFKIYNKKSSISLFIVFLSVSTSQFIYANFIMSEILFQFLIILLCYSFHNVIYSKKWVNLLHFQIIIILLFLTKPIFYLFIIPNIFLGFWFSRYVKKASLYSALPVLVCFLYMGWNYQRTGCLEFSSIQNINLKNYNLYYFNVKKHGEEYANHINQVITNQVDEKQTYAEKQNEIRTLSLNYIKKDWLGYAILHIKGTVRMFLDPGRFDIHNFFELKNTSEVGFLRQINKDGLSGAYHYFKEQPLVTLIILPIVLLFNVFKLIGFVLFWTKNFKNSPPIFWFMFFLIVYLSFLVGAIGASRFLVPVLPIYLIFATLGYSKVDFKVLDNRNI